MNRSAFVVDHDEDIGAELPRGRRKRQHGLETRAVAREQNDAAQARLLRQRREVVGIDSIETVGSRIAVEGCSARGPEIVYGPR